MKKNRELRATLPSRRNPDKSVGTVQNDWGDDEVTK